MKPMLFTEITNNHGNICPNVDKSCDPNVTDENTGLIDPNY